ncbi:MAG: UvrD-helicase domain-containing protein [Bryobacteraceae bacterium]|nr:UvrD-helicase domain-containing protein [Bryobacteraceae bacterium]
MGGFYLNPEQKLAVETIGRPVLVMAPVGTGKTHVLTERIARMLDAGLDPRRILCLSFTNKAAREIRDRLTARFGKPGMAATSGTFHSLCAQMVRAESTLLGIDGDSLIYDEEDCAELFSRISRGRGVGMHRESAEQWHFLLVRAAAAARLSRYDDVPPKGPQRIFVDLLLSSNLGRPDLAESVQFKEWLQEYLHELRENHALDFSDLVRCALDLQERHPDAFARWADRFSVIQVDEVQDTSRSEYRILRALAAAHRQLSFFGDIDQAIYEWRGSAPLEIMADYRERFKPVEVRLKRNYRSTRAILNACSGVIRAFSGAVTAELIAEAREEGAPVDLRAVANPTEEARWIARSIRRLHDEQGVPYKECAVLARTNFTARDLSRVFEQMRLPHVRVDEFKFFQRAEVKAAVAHLRLLLNPNDGNAAQRFLDTPPKGIGEATLRKLRETPREAGLRVCDLLRSTTFDDGEPYAALLAALDRGRVVVFDTETTGRDPSEDEIVEIAAARCGWNKISDEFHALIRPARPVGESEAIHGYSDEYLAEHGRPEAEVMAEFLDFFREDVLAGHNLVSFDIPIVEARLAPLGLRLPNGARAFDTLDISRRLVRLPSHRLADLAAHYGLKTQPTHKAMDDVRVNAELLQHLGKRLREGAAAREEAVRKYGKHFQPQADRLARWRALAETERPPELYQLVLSESGLRPHYEKDPDADRRLEHLEELGRIFSRLDAKNLPPRQALLEVLNLSALGTDLDRHTGETDLVPVLTVHQAKGLEFENVFVANATDSEFPNWRSQRENRLDEEHRLFYVAISRAKRLLTITWPTVNDRGRPTAPSRYLKLLG